MSNLVQSVPPLLWLLLPPSRPQPRAKSSTRVTQSCPPRCDLRGWWVLVKKRMMRLIYSSKRDLLRQALIRARAALADASSSELITTHEQFTQGLWNIRRAKQPKLMRLNTCDRFLLERTCVLSLGKRDIMYGALVSGKRSSEQPVFLFYRTFLGLVSGCRGKFPAPLSGSAGWNDAEKPFCDDIFISLVFLPNQPQAHQNLKGNFTLGSIRLFGFKWDLNFIL